MIEILDKKDCCGCNACVQRCPKQCIAMQEDEEGFIYPKVDASLCIECGLCEKVCPIIHQGEPRKPLNVYAAINSNEEIRMKSSSGGVFTILAEQTIEKGGVVFGARFNKTWDVEHGYTETVDGLSAFRGSKYVQSVVGESYKEAEYFLKSGREVLFSGTPCQIAGLKLFLRKDYENLVSVDLVCHGVPSPMIWREYLKSEIARQCAAGKNSVLTHPLNPKDVRITDIQFRSKATGWKKYSFALTLSLPEGSEKNTVLLSETVNKNLFMEGFLKNLYLRPSCHTCVARKGKSHSDITIGDYWGISTDLDDDKGVSLVLINTQKGDALYSKLNISSVKTTYEQAVAGNPCVERSVATPKYRTLFWKQYNTIVLDLIAPICHKMQPGFVHQSIELAKNIIKRIICKK